MYNKYSGAKSIITSLLDVCYSTKVIYVQMSINDRFHKKVLHRYRILIVELMSASVIIIETLLPSRVNRIRSNPTRTRCLVSSIKNSNLFIIYEGIKLQKCLIDCKKGINVFVQFQYSEFG